MDRLSTNGQMLSQIDLRNVPHSSFDLRNHNYLSGKLGKLIVTRCDEVYPGDRLKGRVQNVVNFEPLAAPLMGTMVDKQESFYVPYSIVWKNANNFFTGKNGFNKSMPSVSPYDVFNAYNEFDLLLPIENVAMYWYDYIIGHTAQSNPILGALTMLNQWKGHLTFFGEENGILDLFQPLINKILSYTGGAVDYADWISDDSKHTQFYLDINKAMSSYTYPDIEPLLNDLLDLLEFEYTFYFGVSTHLDYMGWPVMDNWHDYFFKSLPSGSYNVVTDDTVYPSVKCAFVSNDTEEDFLLAIAIDSGLFSRIKLNFLPFRAAYAIWYWNYRDELLETLALDPESDEFLADTCSDAQIVLCTLLRVRCWYKDSFTTALTNTGDGNLSVPVSITSENTEFSFYDSTDQLINTSDYLSAFNSGATVCKIKTGNYEYSVPMNYLSNTFKSSDLLDDNNAGLSLDLFERVSRLRRFIQKKLILGYEYDDLVWSNFMVKLSNVRMRIPELLSRGRDVVQINTVVNNTNTTEQIAGDKTAVAWANGQGSEIDYFAEEHGLYISYMTILPIQSYAGGLSRKYCKLNPFDFMWPDFATMGMDAVYNYELSAPRTGYSNSGLDDSTATLVFGYQGRYYDLKSKLDEEHGRLRTDLNYLTFSREFNQNNLPKLNYIFVHCWPSVNPFVVGDDEDVFRADVSHEIDFYRRLPVPSEMV